jgi:oligoribonuclease
MSSSPTNTDRSGNLIWIDLEMTGLDTAADTIIEIATIVTDRHLNELAEGPDLAIGQPKTVMDSMDEWNTRQHGESGLTDRVIKSDVTLRKAELATLEFLSHWVDAGVSPICGNSICQDRRFLAREMPELERYFLLILHRGSEKSRLTARCQTFAIPSRS